MHFVKEMQLVQLIWRSMMGKFSGGKKTPTAQLWRWKNYFIFFSPVWKKIQTETLSLLAGKISHKGGGQRSAAEGIEQSRSHDLRSFTARRPSCCCCCWEEHQDLLTGSNPVKMISCPSALLCSRSERVAAPARAFSETHKSSADAMKTSGYGNLLILGGFFLLSKK